MTKIPESIVDPGPNTGVCLQSHEFSYDGIQCRDPPLLPTLIFLLLTSLPALSTVHTENSFPLLKHNKTKRFKPSVKPGSPLKTFTSFYSFQVKEGEAQRTSKPLRGGVSMISVPHRLLQPLLPPLNFAPLTLHCL